MSIKIIFLHIDRYEELMAELLSDFALNLD
jgi:hypothetical protein